MGVTDFDLPFVFIILLPGFLSWAGFRTSSGFKKGEGDFSAICYSIIIGVILWSVMQGNSSYVAKILANPIYGGVALAAAGYVAGFIFGIPFGWIRSKLL